MRKNCQTCLHARSLSNGSETVKVCLNAGSFVHNVEFIKDCHGHLEDPTKLGNLAKSDLQEQDPLQVAI